MVREALKICFQKEHSFILSKLIKKKHFKEAVMWLTVSRMKLSILIGENLERT